LEYRESIFIIVIDDQQDATILVYLFIPNQLYMFSGDIFVRHQEHLTYLQLPILSTDTAAGWCHG